MKLETILKVIEIIRSGEQRKHISDICMDDKYFETYSAKFHLLVSIIEITSWLVSAYDFYSRVVKDR